MINKLTESVFFVLVEFQSMCNSQLFTLREEIYLVVPSSPSHGQVPAPAFVTHHDELSTLNERLSSGRSRRPLGVKGDKQKEKKKINKSQTQKRVIVKKTNTRRKGTDVRCVLSLSCLLNL